MSAAWYTYTLLLHKLCSPVIAEITVDYERCQNIPDSYISYESIIHPISFDWFNRG